MKTYSLLVTLQGSAELTVQAEDEEQATDIALTLSENFEYMNCWTGTCEVCEEIQPNEFEVSEAQEHAETYRKMKEEEAAATA